MFSTRTMELVGYADEIEKRIIDHHLHHVSCKHISFLALFSLHCKRCACRQLQHTHRLLPRE